LIARKVSPFLNSTRFSFMSKSSLTRRDALRLGSAAVAAPFVFRAHAHAAPSETLLHASFGAGGMALSDLRSLTAGENV